METINTRIDALIRKSEKTKTEWAGRLNVTPQFISSLCNGKKSPSDRTIADICREFHINETWLRTGEGEMFAPKEEDAVGQLCTALHANELEEQIVRAYFRIDERIREPFMRQLLQGVQPASNTGNVDTSNLLEESQKKIVKIPKVKKHGGMVEIRVYDQPAAAGLGNYLDDPDFHIEQYPEHILPAGTDFGVIIDGDSMEPKIHDGYTVFVEAMPRIEPGQIGIFIINGKSYCKKLVVDHEKRQERLVSLNPEYEDIIIQEFDFFKTLGLVLGQWGPGSREDDWLDW